MEIRATAGPAKNPWPATCYFVRQFFSQVTTIPRIIFYFSKNLLFLEHLPFLSKSFVIISVRLRNIIERRKSKAWFSVHDNFESNNSKGLFAILSRYYHNVAEHDISEPLSEEDFVRTSMKTSKRQPTDYYWVPRNDPDRYENVTPIMRRARTKPDMDRLIDSEMSKARRCNRCGNLSSKKNEPPVKSTCRFDDSANIPIKGSIGEIPIYFLSFLKSCVLFISLRWK